jgi:hypothetical protein
MRPIPEENRSRHLRQLVFKIVLGFLLCSPVSAQQPFNTDDSDVTPKHHFHFEASNEYDWLQRSAFPSLEQNTADFEVDYGLFEGLEIGIEAPWLAIFSDGRNAPRTVAGLGDTNLSAKYNFHKEREGSRWPAMSVALNIELPTGDVKRQLGSGLTDVFVNGVLQKSLTSKTKLRLNGGILFSGNETTGVIGIKTRGTVLTGGASLVREFNPKLQLGIEVTGAVNKNLQLGKGQLQTLIGGNYFLRQNVSLDFGVVGGRYIASPRAGIQVGVSIDF